MNSLDLKALIKESQFLKNGRIDAIYQNDDELRIRVYVPSVGNYELFINPKRIHLTKHKRPKPVTPSNFAMLLRKYMIGKRIQDISQHKLDRVFEICVNDNILIIEMFHQGNFILCDDAYNIIQPLHFQRRQDRVVVPKEKYKFPPSVEVDDYASFKRSFQYDTAIRKILISMGFSEYSDEILIKSGIDGNKQGQSLAKESIDKLFDAAENLLLKKKIKAAIVYENNEVKNVIPFEMEMFSESKGFTLEKYDSFNKALDVYFNEKIAEPVEEEPEPEDEEKEEDLEREKHIVEKQEETIEEYKEDEEETREEATLIYNNYGLIDNVLATLNNARAKYSWSEIKDIIKKEDSPEANSIVAIKEHENKVVLNIDGNKIELFINKTPEENATYYFEHAKKFKRKVAKAEDYVEKRKDKITAMEEEISPTFTEDEVKEEPLKDESLKDEEDMTVEDGGEEPKKNEDNESEIHSDFSSKQKKKGRWYHKYRYFWSIEGLLVVAGKDATTNEELIKKHTESDDIVLHADIHGAPFVVIKQRRDKREKVEDLTPQGVVEAAEFAASYSKAWQQGLGSVEVYWVGPDQVTKQAEPGQFLPKGSFVIRGQRNYLKSIKLRLAIGADMQNKCFVVAPLKSVAARCDYYVTIQPGEIPADEIARDVKLRLVEKALYPDEKEIIESIPAEQISSRVPSAKASIMDKVESGLL